MLSQGATEQASSVEELAATINELTSHVAQNADSASNATRTAEEVKDYAVESGKRMAEMLEAISNISDRSKEIGKIIKTIEDIAFQTNYPGFKCGCRDGQGRGSRERVCRGG